MPVALAPATEAAPVAAPTTLDTLVTPSSAPTALDALVAAPSTPTVLDTLVGPAPVARVALVRRPVHATTDDASCAPRMTMFQDKP